MFIIPAGGCRMPRSAETSVGKADITGSIRALENIHMDGSGVLSFVESRVPLQVRGLLERNGLTMDDIDLVIFHQASKVTLDSLSRLLHVPSEKAFSNLRDVGNTVSASIPIAVRDAVDQGRLRPGNRLLLSGFGVGMSWATAILQT
jgi:3-oxoacyl-[acyl-carrier-protein] synthase-3